MASPDRESLRRLYDAHPLEVSRILARVKADKGDRSDVSAWDLAVDEHGDLTDQNHVGGAAFCLQLAEAAGIDANTRVWDLGAGLCGPARLLASTYGCTVRAIDLSPARCRAAEGLNRLVGLEDLVSVRCSDYLTAPNVPECIDVLWGQCAWTHVLNKASFLEAWAQSLAPGARIAFEEPCLLRRPNSEKEAELLAWVERTWHGQVGGVAEWEAAVRQAGCPQVVRTVLSQDFTEFLRRTLSTLQSDEAPYHPTGEQPGWAAALELVEAGVIGYLRMVGKKG